MFHDACGVGFIARTRGEGDHSIVAHGLTDTVGAGWIERRMIEHRM